MKIINQPLDGHLGDYLIGLINSQKYHTLNIAVAFAKNSGVLRIKESFEKFRKNNGLINILVGVDMKVTTYEALNNLLSISDSLHVVHIEGTTTFHSKIYHLIGNDEQVVVIGSNNMTEGGLWSNLESSIILHLNNKESNIISNNLTKHFETITNSKDLCRKINTFDDIDLLLQKGYILKEVFAQMYNFNTKSIARNKADKLFSNKPSLLFNNQETTKIKEKKLAEEQVTPKENPIIDIQGASETIWFETKKMTGGSRNILDLSKTSLIERDNFGASQKLSSMGSVGLFGLDPHNIFQKKDITINYKGIDYFGNTILYPEGENANGTWRLQIKGVSNDHHKITDALNSSGLHFLVEKILCLTKISPDYYSMSIFPDSEIEIFKQNSHILARNGKTKKSKCMGIIKIDSTILDA